MGTEYDDCEIIYISNESGEMQEVLQINKVNVKTEELEDTDVSREEFPEVCRTCLFRGELIPIFNSKMSEDSNLTVDQLLKDCIAMNVEELDSLPQNICLMCVQRLMKIYFFRKQCVMNEAMFKLILLNSEDEPDRKIGNLLNETKEETQTQSRGEEDSEEYTNEDHLCFYQQNDCNIDNEDNDDVNNDDDYADDDDVYEDSSSDENSGGNDTMEDSDEDHVVKPSPNELGDQNISIEATLSTQASAQTSEVHSDSEKMYVKKKDESKREYNCNRCKMSFKSRNDYMTHQAKMKHTSHRVLPCPTCSKLFSSAKMRQHMRTHTKEQPYKCDVCPKQFSLQSNLKRHMMRHTGERPHVCEICAKGFIQLASLQKHRETHRYQREHPNGSGYFNFTCEICGRGFKRHKPYELHLKRHNPEFLEKEASERAQKTLERPYGCDICDKRFNNYYHLKTHKLIHGERHYLCSECGRGFVTNAALQSHLKIHTGEKPYTCNICKKSYAHVGTFESHTLIHKGLRPFKCDECGKKFTQWSHLMYHQRTHSGERPYVCSYCGKSFALNGNLTVHVRTHTGETPFSCEICGKGFYDSSSRNKHQRAHETTGKKMGPVMQQRGSAEIIEDKFEIDFKPFNRSLFEMNTFVKSEQFEGNAEEDMRVSHISS